MDQIILNAEKYARKLLKDDCSGHDIDHTLRVFNSSLEIASSYKEVDILILSLIALLHDADDPKLFKSENNENAYTFLASQNLSKNQINLVIAGINEISFSKNKNKKPSTIEAKIVQDADRLDAIGAIGIARTFAYGGMNHRSLDSSIEHFHEKLLLLKDLLNTPEAKKIATKRHKFLLEFLEEYKSETNQ